MRHDSMPRPFTPKHSEPAEKPTWHGSICDHEQRLVAADGEIVAVVYCAHGQGWRLGAKYYISASAARRAAEKQAGGDRAG